MEVNKEIEDTKFIVVHPRNFGLHPLELKQEREELTALNLSFGYTLSYTNTTPSHLQSSDSLNQSPAQYHIED